MPIITNKKTFPDIHFSSFQHPLDVSASESLRKVPLLPTVISWLNSKSIEQILRQRHLENCIRLGPKQGGTVYEAFEHACSILSIEEAPELFIENRPNFNAYTMGMEKRTIILTSSLVDALDEDEILAVLGHELGHVKCEHLLYKTVSYLLSMFGMELIREFIPGLGKAASMGISYAITSWARAAEYSCDRAALLVSQDLEVVTRLTMLLAAGTRKIIPELSMDAVLEQAADLKEMENSFLGKLVLLQELQDTHPVPIRRCVEIKKWAESDKYYDILNGIYTRIGNV